MSTSGLGSTFAQLADSPVFKSAVASFASSPKWQELQQQLARTISAPVLTAVENQNTALSALMGSAVVGIVRPSALNQVSGPLGTQMEGLNRTISSVIANSFTLPDLSPAIRLDRSLTEAYRNAFAAGSLLRIAHAAEPGWLRTQLEMPVESEPEDSALSTEELRWHLITEEVTVLLHTFWVCFVLLQLATPEGRRLLEDYSVIWSLITALILFRR